MNIKKEFRLAIMCLKMRTMERMVDALPFLMLNIGTVVRFIFSIIFFQAIFVRTQVIGGWSFAEVLVLLGTWELINGIAWSTYVRGGFRRLPRYMQNGELDMLLVRPMNLRTYFIYDFNDILFGLPQLIMALLVILYGIFYSGMFLNIFGYLFLLVIGILIHYSFFVIISSVNFWTIVEQITELFDHLTQLGRYPITVYQGFVQLAFTLIIPIACIYSFPVEVLFGDLNFFEFGTTFAVVVVFFMLSHFIWRAGLRRYESTGF